MNTTGPKNTVQKANAPKAPPRRELAFRTAPGYLGTGFETEAEWLQRVTREFSRFVPVLTQKCGVSFHGRILEIGAAGAWFSAELSKLPKVVEILATDFSPRLLKEKSPGLFRLLNAHEAKIRRMPLAGRKLDFPDQHFDFVVCAALLHRALNPVAVLREVRRILKPGGQLVAVREPVRPLVQWKSAARRPIKPAPPALSYTLQDYREFFALAGLDLETRRLNVSEGLKYYFDEVVNGLTHARYVFLATKRRRA